MLHNSIYLTAYSSTSSFSSSSETQHESNNQHEHILKAATETKRHTTKTAKQKLVSSKIELGTTLDLTSHPAFSKHNLYSYTTLQGCDNKLLKVLLNGQNYDAIESIYLLQPDKDHRLIAELNAWSPFKQLIIHKIGWQSVKAHIFKMSLTSISL